MDMFHICVRVRWGTREGRARASACRARRNQMTPPCGDRYGKTDSWWYSYSSARRALIVSALSLLVFPVFRQCVDCINGITEARLKVERQAAEREAVGACMIWRLPHRRWHMCPRRFAAHVCFNLSTTTCRAMTEGVGWVHNTEVYSCTRTLSAPVPFTNLVLGRKEGVEGVCARAVRRAWWMHSLM